RQNTRNVQKVKHVDSGQLSHQLQNIDNDINTKGSIAAITPETNGIGSFDDTDDIDDIDDYVDDDNSANGSMAIIPEMDIICSFDENNVDVAWLFNGTTFAPTDLPFPVNHHEEHQINHDDLFRHHYYSSQTDQQNFD